VPTPHRAPGAAVWAGHAGTRVVIRGGRGTRRRAECPVGRWWARKDPGHAGLMIRFDGRASSRPPARSCAHRRSGSTWGQLGRPHFARCPRAPRKPVTGHAVARLDSRPDKMRLLARHPRLRHRRETFPAPLDPCPLLTARSRSTGRLLGHPGGSVTRQPASNTKVRDNQDAATGVLASTWPRPYREHELWLPRHPASMSLLEERASDRMLSPGIFHCTPFPISEPSPRGCTSLRRS